MGKSYGLTRWQLYKEIILPGAMPSIAKYQINHYSNL
jgi:ABC-type nitrate/sulfonate/bicarbonate transport system permease component